MLGHLCLKMSRHKEIPQEEFRGYYSKHFVFATTLFPLKSFEGSWNIKQLHWWSEAIFCLGHVGFGRAGPNDFIDYTGAIMLTDHSSIGLHCLCIVEFVWSHHNLACQNTCIVAMSLALCSHYGQAAVGAAPFPPPSPCRYWELGERARAGLASRIALCSTHSLPAPLRWGRGQGPCNVTLWCQQQQCCSGNCEGTLCRSDRETLRHLQWSCPTVNSFHLAQY